MEYPDMINNEMMVIEDNCARARNAVHEQDYAKVIALCGAIAFMANTMKKIAKDAKKDGKNA